MFGSSSTTSTFGFWAPSTIASLAVNELRTNLMSIVPGSGDWAGTNTAVPGADQPYPVQVRGTWGPRPATPCAHAIGTTADLCDAAFLAAAQRVKLNARHP